MPGIFRRGWHPRPQRRFAVPVPLVVMRALGAIEWAGIVLDPTTAAPAPIEWAGVPASGSGKSASVHLEFGATPEPVPTPLEWGIAAGGPTRGGPSQIPLEWIGNATLVRNAGLPIEVPGFFVSSNPILPLAPLGGFGGRFSAGFAAEWIADLAIDRPLPIAAPAFTGATVVARRGLPLEWHAGVPGAPVAIEFTASLRADRPLPLALGGSVQLLPGIVLSISAAQIAGRTAGLTASIWFEFGHALPGAQIGLEFGATPLGATRNLPLAIAAQFRTDRLVALEALSAPPFLFRDIFAPLEFGATPEPPKMQLEWRAILTTDRGLLVETTGRAGLRADALLPAEWGQKLPVVIDGLVPIENMALLSANRAIPTYILASSNKVFDRMLPVEWLLRSSSDRGLLAEIARNMNSVVVDRGLPIEALGAVFGDTGLPLAVLPTVSGGRVPIAFDALMQAFGLLVDESSGLLALQRPIPAEMLRAALVDASARIAWLHTARRDAPMPAEVHAALTIANAFLPVEASSPLVAVLRRFPLAWRASLLRAAGLPAEAISPAFSARSELPLETAANLILRRLIPDEWLAGRSMTRPMPAEALRDALAAPRCRAEWGDTVGAGHPVGVAILGSLRTRAGVGIEDTGAVALLRLLPVETLRAALRSGAAPAEILHAAAAAAVLPLDFGGDVLHQARTILPIESAALFGYALPGPTIAFDALFSAQFAELPIAILGTMPPAAIERLTAIGWEALLPPPLIAIDGAKLLVSPRLVRILKGEWRG